MGDRSVLIIDDDQTLVVALKEGRIRFDGDSAALTQGHLSDIYAFDEEMPFEPSA